MGRHKKFVEPTSTEEKPFSAQKYIDETVDNELIKCQLVLLPRYNLVGEQSEKKNGRYSTSLYSDVDGYEKNKWVVLSYIYTDFDKYRKENLTDDVIMKRCLNYLNSIKTKKGENKYGKLALYRYTVLTKNNLEVACSELIINTPKNEHFWKTSS